MIRSMTGFGRGEATGPVGRFVVEARSVNHRFSEVVVRMPRPIASLEERVRKVVQAYISRGRADILIQWEPDRIRQRRVSVDKELAVAYYNALKELGEVIGSKVEITSESLAKLPDVLTLEETQVEPDEVWPTLQSSLELAMADLVAMREREGRALVDDLEQRLRRIEAVLEQISTRAPQLVEEYRQRLHRRLEELLKSVPGGSVVDPWRVAQEVAVYADKSDISEEVARLHSHLAQSRSELNGGGSAAGEGPGAVGRKLEFLVQEMNREINTIASKAQDVAITSGVVEVKSELEKIREQVQNIE